MERQKVIITEFLAGVRLGRSFALHLNMIHDCLDIATSHLRTKKEKRAARKQLVAEISEYLLQV